MSEKTIETYLLHLYICVWGPYVSCCSRFTSKAGTGITFSELILKGNDSVDESDSL